MCKFSKEEIDAILGTDYPDNPLEGGLFHEYREQRAKDKAAGHTKCGTSDCCMKCKTSEIVNELQGKTMPNLRNKT